MMTGSHNPREENGFKLMIGSEPVHGETLRDLVGTAASPAAGGASVDATDGLRVTEPEGWWLLRAFGHGAEAHHPLRGRR